MHPFTLVKNLLRRQGVYIFRAGTLPRQIDLWADLERMAFAPEVIFDIGANVGLFAQGAVAAHPAALIHAFEPVSKTYEKLKAGVAGFPRIHPHQLALGAASGNARMYLRSESQWNSLAAANNLPTPEGDSEIITQTTVDAFCEARQITRIDLLKTDTEGFDYEVLNGARGML